MKKKKESVLTSREQEIVFALIEQGKILQRLNVGKRDDRRPVKTANRGRGK